MTSMPRRLQDWVEALGDCRLPCLPIVKTALQEIASQGDTVPVNELCAIIYRDPALVQHILRFANSLPHRHLASRVNSLEQAVMMIGQQRVLSMPAEMPKLDSLPAVNRDGYLAAISGAYHAACQAWTWARLTRDMIPAEVFTATLLRHVGELALWAYGGNTMPELVEQPGYQQGYQEETEYVHLGFPITELSLALVQRWHLPTLAAENLRPEKIVGRRTLGITLAVRLNKVAHHGWSHPEVRRILKALTELLKTDEPAAAATVQQAAELAARETAFLEPHSFAPLLEEFPEEFEEQTLKRPSSPFCITPQRDLLRRTLAQLAHADYQRTFEELAAKHEHVWDWDPIIALGLRALHGGLGLSRALFCKLNPATDVLEAYMVLGADSDPLFSRFRAALTPGTLIQQLMKIPQTLWLNDTNRAKLLPLIPRPLRMTLGVDSFFAASIFIAGKPFGMVYADRHLPGCELDARSYKAFKEVCKLMKRQLVQQPNIGRA